MHIQFNGSSSGAGVWTEVDALAYSVEFELALSAEIALLQSALDYVALQVQSTHQRRRLTRLEHRTLALSQLAFDREPVFGLSGSRRGSVARIFLVSGIEDALSMISADGGEKRKTFDHALMRLGNISAHLSGTRKFLRWNDPQNLSDLLKYNPVHGVELQTGNEDRKLHYLCQLSVYTSLPNSPDDYPVSLLVTPKDTFGLATMWARKPELWEQEVMVTESGRFVVSRSSNEVDVAFRRNLGSRAKLHLQLAQMIYDFFERNSSAISTQPKLLSSEL